VLAFVLGRSDFFEPFAEIRRRQKKARSAEFRGRALLYFELRWSDRARRNTAEGSRASL
jgi:hypothetical protein